ncbi:hypothetical protein ABT124_48225 [Streptomyces sp. NPDC001982]
MPSQGGKHHAVRPRQTRPDTELPTQHRHLVAQREQLDILGIL